jgi:signal transduction histidine kinase
LTENKLEKKLRVLHEVGNELSVTSSMDELCRRAVELGRNRLGFDRISTWFVDEDPRYIVGSFGVDEKGRLREEADEKVLIDSDPMFKALGADKAHSLLRMNVPLRDNSGKAIGRGSHIIATIWNGKEIVGYLSADNLLKKEPLNEQDRELVELFASTFGHLYSLKLAEDKLKNAYARLKEMQYQLIQAAKMEVIGSLASGVAHEVKNPLAVILQGTDYLVKKIRAKDENAHAAIMRMRIAVKKADVIIKGLLDFSSMTKLDYAECDLSKTIDQALLLVNYEISKSGIEIVRDYKKVIHDVRIDKNKIEQVLINIFLNAANQMPKGGRLTIKTSPASLDTKKAVLIEIEDTGPGVPAGMVNKLFDPFFTTRRGVGGTGLGLTIAKNIIDMHKGSISIENRKDTHGVKVSLVLRA